MQCCVHEVVDVHAMCWICWNILWHDCTIAHVQILIMGAYATCMYITAMILAAVNCGWRFLASCYSSVHSNMVADIQRILNEQFSLVQLLTNVVADVAHDMSSPAFRQGARSQEHIPD